MGVARDDGDGNVESVDIINNELAESMFQATRSKQMNETEWLQMARKEAAAALIRRTSNEKRGKSGKNAHSKKLDK